MKNWSVKNFIKEKEGIESFLNIWIMNYSYRDLIGGCQKWGLGVGKVVESG